MNLVDFFKVSLRGAMVWFLFSCSLRERDLVNLVDYFRLRRGFLGVGLGESGRFFLRYRWGARWIVWGYEKSMRRTREGYEKGVSGGGGRGCCSGLRRTCRRGR